MLRQQLGLASVMPIADIRRIFDVNLMSAIHLCQAAVPVLRNSRAASIVNITSRSRRATP